MAESPNDIRSLTRSYRGGEHSGDGRLQTAKGGSASGGNHPVYKKTLTRAARQANRLGMRGRLDQMVSDFISARRGIYFGSQMQNRRSARVA